MGLTVTENGTEFDRGHAAGQIAERLREHDRHFERINGSLDKMSDSADGLRGELVAEIGKLNMSIQRMTDAMAADRATVLITAGALETARTTARDAAERRWSPFARVMVAVAAAAALIGAVTGLLAAAGVFRH
jgi:hypothetical protein